MSAPERHLVTVEINVAAGQTLHETVDWLNRFFSFYHQSLNAVVISKGSAKPAAPSDVPDTPPGTDLLA